MNINTPAINPGPLAADDLAEGRSCPVQLQPAEACTDIGAQMHHTRPAAGWAVELAVVVVVLLIFGAAVGFSRLPAP